MRHSRHDVVTTALQVLDRHGLVDLTMRRLGAELGVQPSALYHHFRDKQSLLAAVADEILRRHDDVAPVPVVSTAPDRPGDWAAAVSAVCAGLRNAMLAYRDGADVVATVFAFGMGARTPLTRLVAILRDAGFSAAFADTAARTLLHFVFGHTADEQLHLQADAAGALLGSTPDATPDAAIPADSVLADAVLADDAGFAVGLRLIVAGIRAERAATVPVRPGPCGQSVSSTR
ncbi:TetR/AcrR family transcriptional regulator C-terminal domain-containing protein [Nakamurella leprariae]|uniref:TetR/AcrR family transcriptional regulator C-terminal domain-containing protein n=1 Tax=Nakamurella leprariae TaxID=2803911 RepID=A0A939C0B9_9ACTN|nr:TetR/AcrR family transcriptional regulator C-terminal domain-containing protein [Nakamurella leprariae]MBM9468596.1 TetR/AcrR family transcriptional regulator C-terminal domain-containing protein [Nakamurella leprariae]